MELLSELHRTGNTILMVTHNPELTRYADRVVYMHDGSIVHDQRTPIGEMPKLASRAAYLYPRRSEEDDLAGVSAMMEFRPDKAAKKPRKRKTIKSKKPKKVTSKASKA
jgi:energy-coupling factor transporter ATP-binding protein EcfA2